MQGLVNFASAIGDAISASIPAACYLMACVSFFYFGWTLWTWSAPHSRHHHPHHDKPWLPFLSLVMCGVFVTFPSLLNRVTTSMGGSAVASLTSYASATPPTATGLTGATPAATLLNTVTMFQYFFQAFGAACILWSIIRWRGIALGRLQGSPLSCGIQFLFGAMLVNVNDIAAGVVAMF